MVVLVRHGSNITLNIWFAAKVNLDRARERDSKSMPCCVIRYDREEGFLRSLELSQRFDVFSLSSERHQQQQHSSLANMC